MTSDDFSLFYLEGKPRKYDRQLVMSYNVYFLTSFPTLFCRRSNFNIIIECKEQSWKIRKTVYCLFQVVIIFSYTNLKESNRLPNILFKKLDHFEQCINNFFFNLSIKMDMMYLYFFLIVELLELLENVVVSNLTFHTYLNI